MELYNAYNMPLSNNEEIKKIQEKQINGKSLSIQEKIFLAKKELGGRDHTIRMIGEYECKPYCCYRCISLNTLEKYREYGYIIDERRSEYIEGENNQGIDWYLGGCMPSKYGFIILECPADKNFFVPTREGGYGMSDDIFVRHMKSSPKQNPIPMRMITNIFDYSKIVEENERIRTR